MIQFLKAGASTAAKLSRLTLAVVTGLLQSLVEATPQHIGQTYLHMCLTAQLQNLREPRFTLQEWN
jgi:hypothetical protein